MTDDCWACCTRVGLKRPDGVHPSVGTFDALADPAATDALAGALADRLCPFGPDLIVVWEGLNSAMLGFAVGLRLGIAVTVLTDDEGLVTAATPVRRGSRAVLVSALSPDESISRMVAGYLQSQGIALAATAVLLGRADRRDAGTSAGRRTDEVVLIALPPVEPPASGLTRQSADLAPNREPRSAPRPERR